MKKLFCILVMTILLSGCASSGTKIDQNRVRQIKEGVTTKEEVIRLLGNPFTQTLTSDKKVVMMFQYTKVKNRVSNFIPVVNLLAGGVDMKQQILQILIDENGLVEKYIFTDSDNPINSGLLNTY